MNVTRRKNDNTPVRNQFESLLEDANMSCEDLLPNSDACVSGEGTVMRVNEESVFDNNSFPTTSTNAIPYEQFGMLLDSKIEQIRNTLLSDFKKEFSLAVERLKSEFTQSLEFIAAEQNSLKDDVKTLRKTVHTLQEENTKLKSDVNDASRRLAILEKSSRSRNIEIHLIPEKRNENILGIIKKICEVVKAPITESDICAFRRVSKLNASSDRPRNILVTLPSERHRDVLISAFRRYNKTNKSSSLNTSDLQIPGDKKNIFLAEHLSPECKIVHAATRKMAKERSYTFVWVRNDRVYTRKNEQSPALLIKNIEDLKKLT
ncbi:uncharacterized protein LOC125077977 [Vanessa atalanta]|uniref:uncharacterized protein LOC125077977 n=1 Tax=Vanessa atalanta TaxID=42275 RepID=UPI001FCE1671|nr:uncharacterized protein LOC125077977 [Vanessa atalanta]